MISKGILPRPTSNQNGSGVDQYRTQAMLTNMRGDRPKRADHEVPWDTMGRSLPAFLYENQQVSKRGSDTDNSKLFGGSFKKEGNASRSL